ncbi:matrixin family metalloprotease [Elstera sp.]|jgi:Ca2+-binding RTX toxin-like protein|uniref:matrixin family metalloprotease n=1 Tax=Elstera sp. TaxID=1916664 RepID=UPI0037C10913
MAQPVIPTLTASDQALAVSTLVDDSLGRWNATSVKGAAVTVQYSFGASVPTYASRFTDTAAALTTFQPLTETMKAQTRDALAAWSAVANITFVEVSDSSSVGMRFFTQSDASASFAGFAWGAGSGSQIGANQNGDVWINRAQTDTGYNPLLLMHEIGHTLGLKHPHESPVLADAKDSIQTTVMSYDQEYNYDIKVTATRTATGVNWSSEYVRLETNGQAHLGIFDVAAVQALYGAKTNSVNDTYRFSTDPFTKMIYDGGGSDIIDLSNQLYGSVLDLTPGTFSSIGKQTLAQAIDREINELSTDVRAFYTQDNLVKWYTDRQEYLYLGQNNLSIAYGTIIESVTGSAKDDIITGNSANNFIQGGAGNDTLSGGAGTDTAFFSGAYANYRFAVANGTITVSGTDGRDTLTGFETLQFGDGRTVDASSVTTTILSSPVYRFYNTVTGTHLYTMSTSERDTIQSNLPQYSFDGIAFSAYEVGAGDTASVYRFFNSNTGTHFYTASSTERDAVAKLSGFAYEGVAYIAGNTSAGGLDPLYRFYNSNTGSHFYTASETERAAVAKLVGFVDEGIAYYVDA